MDGLFSGIAENLGRAIAHLFTAQGAPFWLLLSVPITLIACPLVVIRPAEASKIQRIGKGLLAALPAFWIAVCVLTTAFAYNDKLARFDLAAAVFYIFIAMIALTMMAGVAATVMIRGWHRLTAMALLIVNMWLITAATFLGAIVIGGTTS